MIYTALTKKAMTISFEAHKNQKDKSGCPYVFHPFNLAEQMDDEYSTIVALLHDVVEDTEITIDDLRKEFPEEVIEAIGLMTHESGEEYMSYVSKIKENPIARKVKIADLTHNSDLTRMETVTEKDVLRREKYQKALELLKR